MEIWKKIPTFPNYEISNEGIIRNVNTGDLKTISYIGDTAFVQLSYKGKTYNRSLKKLMRIVFHIKQKRRGGHPPRKKEIEIEKEGYFKF